MPFNGSGSGDLAGEFIEKIGQSLTVVPFHSGSLCFTARFVSDGKFVSIVGESINTMRCGEFFHLRNGESAGNPGHGMNTHQKRRGMFIEEIG